jgi:histone acetyltransferase MYST2
VKKAAGPKGPCPRKCKGRGGTANSDTSQTPAVEERHCPLDGCDSMGHLGGRAEKHFTIEACPKYHNKTAQECKVSGSYHYVLASHDPFMWQGEHNIYMLTP